MRTLWSIRLVLLTLLLVVASVRADDLLVAAYNVESGGADIAKISARVGAIDGVAIWGFSEVEPAWVEGLVQGAALTETGQFAAILGTTGGNDRLAIVYDTNRLEYIAHQELGWINPMNRVRAPLVAEMRDKVSGQRFLFTVNHLYRSRADQRHEQARLLNEWASKQTLPLIAVGDFNFDFQIEGGDTDASKRDPGYDLFTAGGVMGWVRPATLARTTCPNRYEPAVLDFVFANAGALAWARNSTILTREEDCADVEGMPDHFPVLALFDLPRVSPEAAAPPEVSPVSSPRVTKSQILERIGAIEKELAELRRLVEGM